MTPNGGAVDGHAPTHEPARSAYWIHGQGRCPDCQVSGQRPELVDGQCPHCRTVYRGDDDAQ